MLPLHEMASSVTEKRTTGELHVLRCPAKNFSFYQMFTFNTHDKTIFILSCLLCRMFS